MFFPYLVSEGTFLLCGRKWHTQKNSNIKSRHIRVNCVHFSTRSRHIAAKQSWLLMTKWGFFFFRNKKKRKVTSHKRLPRVKKYTRKKIIISNHDTYMLIVFFSLLVPAILLQNRVGCLWKKGVFNFLKQKKNQKLLLTKDYQG